MLFQRKVWIVLLFMGSANLVFCGAEKASDSEAITTTKTWDEFRAETKQDPESNLFIVDRDVPLPSEKLLHEYFISEKERGDKLIVAESGGVDLKWNASDRHTLTYCVSNRFGSRYEEVVKALDVAASDWSSVADVSFQHIVAEDALCTKRNHNVLFDVNPTRRVEWVARSFFPNFARAQRNLMVNVDQAFSMNEELAFVFRHELGHILGFRHEHTRPQGNPNCFEDNAWRALTPFDIQSVMYYPICGGRGSGQLSPKDRKGAEALYGAPKKISEKVRSLVSHSEVSGHVSIGESQLFGPFEVSAGAILKVELTGTDSGDADLYVRFESKPSLTKYDCRPYLDTTDETCSLDVPFHATKAFVLIVGSKESKFNLQLEAFL